MFDYVAKLKYRMTMRWFVNRDGSTKEIFVPLYKCISNHKIKKIEENVFWQYWNPSQMATIIINHCQNLKGGVSIRSFFGPSRIGIKIWYIVKQCLSYPKLNIITLLHYFRSRDTERYTIEVVKGHSTKRKFIPIIEEIL